VNKPHRANQSDSIRLSVFDLSLTVLYQQPPVLQGFVL